MKVEVAREEAAVDDQAQKTLELEKKLEAEEAKKADDAKKVADAGVAKAKVE